MFQPNPAMIAKSHALRSGIHVPMPGGVVLYPHQIAGVEYMAGLKSVLCADLPGCGKTLQTIALANHLGWRKLLVVVPAGLRLVWLREYERGSIFKPRICVVMSGRDPIAGDVVIISYDLAVRRYKELMPMTFDALVADEAHYLKDRTSKRTRLVLGTPKFPGLVSRAGRHVFLSGTPAPNAPHEFFPILRRAVPALIEHAPYQDFVEKYAHVSQTPWGMKVYGSRNEADLAARLRSGFMLRREREAILPELPEKTHKMVVWPADGAFPAIIERERPFSAAEIVEHGVPVGTALPEIRRAMGEAKAPLVAQYVRDLLDDADEKILVFAHHKSVVDILSKALASYGVVAVTGSTPPLQRNTNVDRFQNDPRTRVMVANIVAGGTGLTLTAARQVVFCEFSYVPGENDQAQDRVYRIGQQRGVVIHWPVVQGSLDAEVLKIAAKKQAALNKIMEAPAA
jgi:SWI/SNF-related matrix-associated actin-dependent regulator 1 of chromatin subfamily A